MPTKLESLNESTSVSRLRGDVSPSLHPDQLVPEGQILVADGPDDVGSAAYLAARRAAKVLYESLVGVASAHEEHLVPIQVGRSSKDGKPIVRNDIDPAHVDSLRTAFSQSYQRAAVASAASIEAIDKAIGTLESQVAGAIRHPRASSTDVASAAVQIRSYVNALPPGDRINKLHQLIVTDGDHEVAAAVLASSPWTSGLDRADHARVREWAATRFAPAESAKLAAVRNLRGKVESALNVYAERFSKLMPSARPTSARETSLAALRAAA